MPKTVHNNSYVLGQDEVDALLRGFYSNDELSEHDVKEIDKLVESLESTENLHCTPDISLFNNEESRFKCALLCDRLYEQYGLGLSKDLKEFFDREDRVRCAILNQTR